MSAIEHNDPLNAQILAVSEDEIQGFVREPFAAIAEQSGVPLETVLARLKTMLAAGTIRRIRQTLVASNLAEGALVAWKVPEEKLNHAFDFMFQLLAINVWLTPLQVNVSFVAEVVGELIYSLEMIAVAFIFEMKVGRQKMNARIL